MLLEDFKEKFKTQLTHQPRTAIVEAVEIVLKTRARWNSCPQCTLGMLLNELGFLEYEFVAAGISLPCIVATKTTINWDALMRAIEIKRSKKEDELQNQRVEDCSCALCVALRGEVPSDVKEEEPLIQEVLQDLHKVGISVDDIKARFGNQRPYWLNESLKTEDLKKKNNYNQ